MSTFANYTEISVSALSFNAKNYDLLAKKQEIINSIISHHKVKPRTILFYGFSPLILSCGDLDISVTSCNQITSNFLTDHQIKHTYITDAHNIKSKFDLVIAADEFLTYATTEDQQRALTEQLLSQAKTAVVTTLRDYKNQEFKDREFSLPLAIHNSSDTQVYLEYHNYDFNDRNSWQTLVYELSNENKIQHGPFNRRAMFFKQLAKFGLDAGAKSFYVHKNLMYKSVIKRNYEHIISLSI